MILYPQRCCYSQFCTTLGRRSFGRAAYKLSKQRRTNLIFGANTNVGKTVVSGGLVRAGLAKHNVHYIKPLQCGGSDERFIQEYAAPNNSNRLLSAVTLFGWDTPVSPHQAAQQEHRPVSDKQVLEALQSRLSEISHDTTTTNPYTTTYIETAGGVLSPSASSPENNTPKHAGNEWGWVTQGDLYQPILGYAPVVLVGDGQLGGISCTISAMESLILRGYDIAALVLIASDEGHPNIDAISDYVSRKGFQLRSGSGETIFPLPSQSMFSLPPIPADPTVKLHDWYESQAVESTFSALDDYLQLMWEGQVSDVIGLAKSGKGSANAVFWPDWNTESVLVDSASGDNLHVIQNGDTSDSSTAVFDGTSSGWSQGVGHGEPTLALALASAAGRYGNVSGPNVIHAPAVNLAQALVGSSGPGAKWASRVFFTDDGGSSAIEAAIRMGIKLYCLRKKLSRDEIENAEWAVAVQEDCYHGDTLGALNIAEEYVEREHAFYEPKGFWIAPPTVGFEEGTLRISLPEDMEKEDDVAYEYESIDQVMNLPSRPIKLKSLYKEMIEMQLMVYEYRSLKKIGAVVIEPILQCTGGMKWVDPLWQRALVDIARARDIPVIFDESSTGLFRLGLCSSRELLHTEPDIAVFSKLLTSGVVPLSVTLVKEEVFEAFKNHKIAQFLVNANTYVAPPAACNVALQALSAYKEAVKDNDQEAKFDEDLVRELSRFRSVKQSFAFGSVVSVALHTEDEERGQSLSQGELIVEAMRERGVLLANHVHGVVYIMASPLASQLECTSALESLHAVLSSL